MTTRQHTLKNLSQLPSIPAAILTGSVLMPLFVWILGLLESAVGNQLLSISWFIVGFVVPVFLSTVDFRYAFQEWIKGGLFRSSFSFTGEDLRRFYIPAWIRMCILFVCAGASILVLKATGIDL